MIIVLFLLFYSTLQEAKTRGRPMGGGNITNSNNSVTKKQFLLDPLKPRKNQGGQQMELFNCRPLWNFVIPQAMAGNSKRVTKRNTANKILELNC